MSECAAAYAKCLANPFNGPIACLPASPSVMSHKFRSWNKGTIITGTAGYGFIYADPRTGVTNDLGFGLVTQSAFAGTTFTYTGVGVQAVTSNSAFDAASFSALPAGNAYRVVAAGIRIRYIGTELNRGGQILALADPTGSPMTGMGSNSILAEVTSRKFPVNRTWTTVLWRPTTITDKQFVTNPGLYADVASFGTIGFLVVSPQAGIAAEFEYELSAVYEINGRNVRGQTVTPVDTNGQEAIYSASLTSKSIMPHQENTENSAINFLQESAHALGKMNSYMTSAAEVIDKGAALGGTLFHMGETVARIIA